MKRKPYPSDLTDEQWALLEPLLPDAKPGGHPRTTNLREALNALFYLMREGCSWRAIPHAFGIPWRPIYNYYRAWTADGTWERLVAAFRIPARRGCGRAAGPPRGHVHTGSGKCALGW